MTSIILLFVLGFGFVKLGKFVRNNPGTSMEAAKWIKGMFGR